MRRRRFGRHDTTDVVSIWSTFSVDERSSTGKCDVSMCEEKLETDCRFNAERRLRNETLRCLLSHCWCKSANNSCKNCLQVAKRGVNFVTDDWVIDFFSAYFQQPSNILHVFVDLLPGSVLINIPRSWSHCYIFRVMLFLFESLPWACLFICNKFNELKLVIFVAVNTVNLASHLLRVISNLHFNGTLQSTYSCWRFVRHGQEVFLWSWSIRSRFENLGWRKLRIIVQGSYCSSSLNWMHQLSRSYNIVLVWSFKKN